MRTRLQTLFKGTQITAEHNLWNKPISEVRISVELVFRGIVSYFKYLDFRKNLKVELSAVGKMYIVSVLLQDTE